MPGEVTLDPESRERLLASSPSESTALLLELARGQASRRRPADLIAQQERDAYVAPGELDQRSVNAIDALALGAAAEFEAVQLSPVAPLGVCSALAPSSQDRTLSTTRGTEVVSDPTNVLALLCAQRLKRAPRADVRLCTVHQVMRAQPLPKGAGFTRHFRMLTLGEAGPGRADDGFEVDAFARHVAVWDRFLAALQAQGSRFRGVRATFQIAAGRETLATRVERVLRTASPELQIAKESFESRYYDGFRVLYGADAPSGEHVNFADTGVFDWVAKLVTNRRMRFVASGFGLLRAATMFRTG